jgi:hypothetical protein
LRYFSEKSEISIFFVCFLLIITLPSCQGPPIPSPTPNDPLILVQISNPEWEAPIGFPIDPITRRGPGFEVEVSVQTLNSANQATNFSTVVKQFPNLTKGPDAVLNISGVKIPTSGAYVIQYTLKSLDCTWAAGLTCFRFGGGASRKYYKDQFTYTNGGNPSSHYFLCTIQNKYYDACCP